IVRDYLAGDRSPSSQQVDHALERLGHLTDVDLLNLTTLSRAFGYSGTIEALDTSMSPRGYRVLHRVPRLQTRQIDRLVGAFGTLQGLLAATAADLQAVDGVGALWRSEERRVGTEQRSQR